MLEEEMSNSENQEAKTRYFASVVGELKLKEEDSGFFDEIEAYKIVKDVTDKIEENPDLTAYDLLKYLAKQDLEGKEFSEYEKETKEDITKNLDLFKKNPESNEGKIFILKPYEIEISEDNQKTINYIEVIHGDSETNNRRSYFKSDTKVKENFKRDSIDTMPYLSLDLKFYIQDKGGSELEKALK